MVVVIGTRIATTINFNYQIFQGLGKVKGGKCLAAGIDNTRMTCPGHRIIVLTIKID